MPLRLVYSAPQDPPARPVERVEAPAPASPSPSAETRSTGQADAFGEVAHLPLERPWTLRRTSMLGLWRAVAKRPATVEEPGTHRDRE